MGEDPGLATLSAESIAGGVREGSLSAREVTAACLDRLTAWEPAIDAYLEVFGTAALDRAEEIDQRRRHGEDPGVLAGVPVAIKDNLAVAGRATTCASRILQGYTSPYTATAVERLVAAGAVLVGKTNLDEFAMGSSCENSAFQVTRNPWDPERVPGGSSGGSAATVAAGGVPLALGSDTGGSIRQPAAFCGVVGLKPGYGRVSRYGLVAFASSLDQIGPFARSVRDAALALRVIAGVDDRDATSSRIPVDDYLETVEEGIDGLRVGRLREIDSDLLDGDSRRQWDRALERVADLGAEIVEVSVPNVEVAIAAYYVLANSEASANLARFDGVRYGRRAPSDSLDELYLESRSQGFGAEVKRRIMLGTFALSAGYYEAYYGRARQARAALRQQFEHAFGEVDVVATPTTPTAAFGIGEKVETPLEMYLSDVFTTPASLAGLPAISVPCGCDAHGLPLALQIMGPAAAEAVVLRVARAFEREVDWTVAPATSSPPEVG